MLSLEVSVKVVGAHFVSGSIEGGALPEHVVLAGFGCGAEGAASWRGEGELLFVCRPALPSLETSQMVSMDRSFKLVQAAGKCGCELLDCVVMCKDTLSLVGTVICG